MSADIATLGIRVDSSQVKQADTDLNKLTKSGGKAENATAALTNSFGGLKTAILGLGLGMLVREAIQMADTWKNVQGRLSLVTSGTGELTRVTEQLMGVANRTRNGFEATADLYANLARTTVQLGASQRQLLQVTESISQALIVSGATASGSEAALRQLGQAFASGALRGDELNSIMENTPRIAQAIADGMGITIGQLRKLGKEGKLTGDAIFNALLSQQKVLEEEFSKMPVTVSQSLTVLKNGFMQYVGNADNMTGATTAISGAIVAFSKTLDVVIPAVILLGTALGVGFVRNAIAARLAAVATTSTLGTMGVVARGAGAALLGAFGGPIGLAITATGAALAYTYGETIRANSAIDGMEAATKTANTELEVAIARASQAGVNVATLGAAAGQSKGKIDSIASSYNNAATAAQRLAHEAKEAAKAVAMGNIANLQARQAEALGPLKAVDEGTAAIMADPWRLQPVTTLRRGIGVARQKLGYLMGGPSEEERRRSAASYDAAIEANKQTLKVIDATPDSAFTEKPLNSIPQTDDKKKKKGGKSERERAIEEAERFVEALDQETAAIGKNAIETKMLSAQQAAAKAPTVALKNAIMASAAAWRDATIAQAHADFKREVEDTAEAIRFETSQIGMNASELQASNVERQIALRIREMERQGITGTTDAISAETEALRKDNEERRKRQGLQNRINFAQKMKDDLGQKTYEQSLLSMSNEEQGRANVLRERDMFLREEARAGRIKDQTEMDKAIINLSRETDALIANAEAVGRRKDATEEAKRTATSMRDVADAVRDTTSSFGELFGTAGEGFANLLNVILDFDARQADSRSRLLELQEKYHEGQQMSTADQFEQSRIQEEMSRNRIAQYGNMLSAAKGFFNEGSKGYRILETAERAYRIFQFAMQIKSMIMDRASTASSVANSGIRAAADGVAAFAKTLASLPFPLNLAAGAAVLAALVAVGVKIAGGGGKGKASSSSGPATDALKEPPYNGPRDEYGAPTSSYSVLRPGAVTTTPNGSAPVFRGAPAAANNNVGSFRGGDLIIQGGADRRTIEELEPVFHEWSKKTVEDARQASAADRAKSNERWRHSG